MKPPEAPAALNLTEDDIGRLAALITEKQARGVQASIPAASVPALGRTDDRKRSTMWGSPALLAATIGVGLVTAGALWLFSGDDNERSGHLDCSDVTYAEAQRLLLERPDDAYVLDGDRDGEACEGKR